MAEVGDDNITATIKGSVRGVLKASTVASKLKNSLTVVQRHLDRMCREGKLECVEIKGEAFFRVLVDGVPSGVLPRRAKVVSDDSDEEDSDDLDNYALTFEMKRAAALWKERMGDQRWHDDPRALAERVRQMHMQPPFSNQPVREL